MAVHHHPPKSNRRTSSHSTSYLARFNHTSFVPRYNAWVLSVACVTFHLLVATFFKQLSFHAGTYECIRDAFTTDAFITDCLPTARLDIA